MNLNCADYFNNTHVLQTWLQNFSWHSHRIFTDPANAGQRITKGRHFVNVFRFPCFFSMIPISAFQSSQAVLSLHSSPCVARTFPAITSIVKSWPHSVVMFPNLFPVLQHHFFFPNLGGYRRGNQLKPAYFAHITMKFVARSGIC